MRTHTLAVHGGYDPEEQTGATATPIFQTISYAYRSAEELAEVFAGTAPGYIYTRIANPTTYALERRLTQLEDGIGSLVCSSGMAAITCILAGLLHAGDHILSAAGIFGGTVSLFKNTFGRFGVETTLVDAGDTEQFAKNIRKNTRLIFIETIGNPRMDVPDIPAIAEIAHQAGIPLVVDNTLTTPVLIRPKDWGADIVVHSTTKFINGHGNSIGGVIIDTGNFSWEEGPFKDIRTLAEKAGELAFLGHLRNLIYRDLGCCASAFNSFLTLTSLETLPGRMERHCANAALLAEYFGKHPKVRWVNYPGLPSSQFHGRVQKLFGGHGGGLLTFGLASREAAFKFINATKLAQNLANLGDAKTLVIHPSSTIFHEFPLDEQKAMGVTEDMVRVSVGIEDFDDIESDFAQALGQT
ncbi:MAG: O-acetylhomoserine aminocarboxypropyltransferase/cysteine synthase [Phycisphaerae bacterium]|nr:O-acetylhomoserine aminocarboxypropyltransferase/cysteine synthase [Phycisphaerae bacterium]